ncbi:hypothetical protein [Capnocytophaga catalasegens]|uniref:hypothetical protein n=1 Tax=Capnocytophaga catalasegens TaxID=1004260 RepID=UPI0022304E5F|nr:hypothetical protein [Capnocytophaga catalasegens]
MDFDNEHKKHLNLYLNGIERLFYDLIDTLTLLALRVQIKDFFFAFDKYSKIKK